MTSLTTASVAKTRLVDTLILDAGPILSSAAAPSYYLAAADRILTTPAVVFEIRDVAARSRFETVWSPFITQRTPKPSSIKFVAEFAKKTGDYAVLSATDLGLVALAYEAELEVAGGDWRLKNAPGQKELNGPIPERWGTEGKIVKDGEKIESTGEDSAVVAAQLEATHLGNEEEEEEEEEEGSDSEDSDSEGWITPSNLHRHINPTPIAPTETPSQKLTVALSTIDFALQNVLLQMNLHLLSPTSLQRITQTRSTVLRCHGCFLVLRTPPNNADFCPRCGGIRTLLRTTCSTDAEGGFKIHLKRNFQYNNRGNVYSIPKPVAGTCSMKGVPDAPVLREDQKEYTRAARWEGYRKEKDMLDPDVLPNIFTGERRRGSAIRIGVGRRNPNEPKRGGGRRKR